jgi:hypothetical protein
MHLNLISTKFNVIPIIDDLIMELSLIKNGYPYNSEELVDGLKEIETLISDSINFMGKANDKMICGDCTRDDLYYAFTKSKLSLEIMKLKETREKIRMIVCDPQTLDKDDIDNMQEALLKISLPLWKEQVLLLKPNQFKLIEF